VTAELVLPTDPGRAAFERAAGDVIAAKSSPATRYAYGRDLAGWLTFCQLCTVDPCRATLHDAARYRDALQGSADTIRRRLATLSSIYRTLRRAGVAAGNPFHPEALTWPTPGQVLKAARITEAQAQAILLAAENVPRDAAVLRLLYDTGWRRTVVAELPRANYRDGRVYSRGKGGKEVEAELPAITIAALERQLAEARASAYVFPAEGPNAADGHLHQHTINAIVSRYAAAIAPDAHPHSFRALFIRAGFDAGLPSYEVQGAAGHASADMTARYDGKARGAGVARKVAAFREQGAKRHGGT
jgi:integrase/recombinase XerD